MVLDRVIGLEDGISVKLNVVFDAGQVQFKSLAARIEEYLGLQLERVGLELEQGIGNG